MIVLIKCVVREKHEFEKRDWWQLWVFLQLFENQDIDAKNRNDRFSWRNRLQLKLFQIRHWWQESSPQLSQKMNSTIEICRYWWQFWHFCDIRNLMQRTKLWGGIPSDRHKCNVVNLGLYAKNPGCTNGETCVWIAECARSVSFFSTILNNQNLGPKYKTLDFSLYFWFSTLELSART